MTNVADKLRTPAKKWPWFVGVPLVAVLAGGAWVGASALNVPTAAPTPTMTPYVAVLTADELDSVQAGADQQGAIIAADKAAAEKAAADAAAAQAAAQAAADAAKAKPTHNSANSSGLPSGAEDPLNSFGSPDTTLCASGSASDNADGVAICD